MGAGISRIEKALGWQSASARIELADLYRDELQAVIRTLRRQGVAEAELPDAAHEVFVVALRRRQDLAQIEHPRAWIFGVARHVAANRRRKLFHRRERERAWAESQNEGTAVAMAKAETVELRLALDDFLARLRPELREVFVLGELEGLTRNELAEALELAPGTAYSRLRAARKCFAEHFAEPEQGRAAIEGEREHARGLILAVLPSLPASLSGTGVTAGGLALSIKAFLLGAVTSLAGVAAVVAVADASPPQASPPKAAAHASAASSHVTAKGATKSSPALMPAPEVQAAPEPPPAPAEEPVTRATARHRDAVPVPANPALEREVRALASARRALAAEDLDAAARELASLAESHEGSPMPHERAALETELACRRALAERGAPAWAEFQRRYPTSSYQARLRLVCEAQ